MKNRIYFAISLAGALVCALPNRATAQPQAPLVLAGGPIQVNQGDQVVVCATNLNTQPISVTLEFMDALTGAVSDPDTLTLNGVGLNGTPVGGCHSMVVTKITDIIIGLVRVNPQPLPPRTDGLVASLQVFPMGTSAGPAIVRYVPLQPPGPPVCQ